MHLVKVWIPATPVMAVFRHKRSASKLGGLSAMTDLLHGVRRFANHVFPARRDHFETLAAGQRPPTLFITCSDSRIVPHLLMQAEPGELFVLRNAGNLVPPNGDFCGGEAATIEYAVKVLKVEHIVICGHSHCGAITGLLRPESLKGLPLVEAWLKHAERTRQEILNLDLQNDPGDDVLTAAIKRNVLVQLDHLRTYPVVSEAEASGQITLHGWFYRFECGEVLAFSQSASAFASVIIPAEKEAAIA
jgi:carbonic anhydrase